MGNRVEPIRDSEKIKQIKKLLRDWKKWRDYVLFVCGINFGLRIGDLLQIKVKDVFTSEQKIKSTFEVIEQKTQKRNTIKINSAAREILKFLKTKTETSGLKLRKLYYIKLWRPYYIRTTFWGNQN